MAAFFTVIGEDTQQSTSGPDPTMAPAPTDIPVEAPESDDSGGSSDRMTPASTSSATGEIFSRACLLVAFSVSMFVVGLSLLY
jgi:hypothetical protein